jgi:hypothetical protein
MKVRADMVKQALAKRHWQDFFLTEVKNGATHTNNELLKMDAMAIKKSWANPCITGYEVKVDRSDFTRDNKWPGYMAYCNQFSFVCQTGLIQPDELPIEVGLIYYNPEKHSLTTKRKALYRNVDIPSAVLYYIIMNRLDNDRHPFFSNQREFIKSYMQDKEDRQALGRQFGIKISREIKEMRERTKDLERDKERNRESKQVLDEVRDILREFGIQVNSWGGWQTQLKTMLKGSGVSPQAVQEVKRLLTHAEALSKLLNPVEQEAVLG